MVSARDDPDTIGDFGIFIDCRILSARDAPEIDGPPSDCPLTVACPGVPVVVRPLAICVPPETSTLSWVLAGILPRLILPPLALALGWPRVGTLPSPGDGVLPSCGTPPSPGDGTFPSCGT